MSNPCKSFGFLAPAYSLWYRPSTEADDSQINFLQWSEELEDDDRKKTEIDSAYIPLTGSKDRLYKTKMCSSFAKLGYCEHGQECFNAHHPSEIRKNKHNLISESPTEPAPSVANKILYDIEPDFVMPQRTSAAKRSYMGSRSKHRTGFITVEGESEASSPFLSDNLHGEYLYGNIQQQINQAPVGIPIGGQSQPIPVDIEAIYKKLKLKQLNLEAENEFLKQKNHEITASAEAKDQRINELEEQLAKLRKVKSQVPTRYCKDQNQEVDSSLKEVANLKNKITQLEKINDQLSTKNVQFKTHISALQKKVSQGKKPPKSEKKAIPQNSQNAQIRILEKKIKNQKKTINGLDKSNKDLKKEVQKLEQSLKAKTAKTASPQVIPMKPQVVKPLAVRQPAHAMKGEVIPPPRVFRKIVGNGSQKSKSIKSNTICILQ
ncbi:unnamed protein product [Moneuplotes crassus]|uniref:C3H1-type domain-containing protein n=1 Tax=Euplotes crassus TaxID=5936 RepID=A0AAD1UJK3_EUPCR|nr:unnamed protein product [Moneuplotes crassus]